MNFLLLYSLFLVKSSTLELKIPWLPTKIESLSQQAGKALLVYIYDVYGLCKQKENVKCFD
jgi:hypothetical protein